MNALFNLSDLCFQRDRYEEALSYLDDALAVARRRGSRPGEWSVLGETTYPLFMQGRWDEALALFAEVPEERLHEGTTESFLSSITEIHIARGEVERAAHVLSLYAPYETAENLQRRSMYLAAAASVARAEGRLEEAIEHGLEATRLARDVGGEAFQQVKLGLVEAIEAALALDERDRAEELVASIEAVPPGLRSPYLGAQAERFRALLAGDDGAVERFEAAELAFAALGTPFWLAVTMLQHSELGGDASLLDEAREIFDGLKATPWLERAGRSRGCRGRVGARGRLRLTPRFPLDTGHRGRKDPVRVGVESNSFSTSSSFEEGETLSRRRTFRLLVGLVATGLTVSLVAATTGGAAKSPAAGGASIQASYYTPMSLRTDTVTAIVELAGDPIAEVQGKQPQDQLTAAEKNAIENAAGNRAGSRDPGDP